MLGFPFFGPPNVRRLLKRRDIKGLIAALHYKKTGEYEKSSEVRRTAAEALGATNDPRAVEPLLEILGAEQWIAPQLEGLAAITSLGKLRDTRATKPLIEVLGAIRYGLTPETERDVVQKVVRALAEIEGSAIIRMLLPPWEYGSLATSALPEALSVIGQELAVETMTAALTDRDKDLGKKAASALERIAAEMDRDTVDRVTFRRCEFILRNPLIVDSLLDVYRNEDDDEGIRRAAITALAKSKDPRVAGVLREALADVDDLWAQKRAARASAELGDREAIPFLVSALQDRNSPGRRAIAEALGRLGWEPSSDTERAWRMVSLAEWTRDVENLVTYGAEAIPPALALWTTEWATPSSQGCLIVQHALGRLLERHATHFAPADLALIATAADPEVRHETAPDSGLQEVRYERVDISRLRELAQQELKRRELIPEEALKTWSINDVDPACLDLATLIAIHRRVPRNWRHGVVQHVCTRQDMPQGEKLDFLCGLLEGPSVRWGDAYIALEYLRRIIGDSSLGWEDVRRWCKKNADQVRMGG